MSQSWAVSLPAASWSALAPLRLIPEIEILDQPLPAPDPITGQQCDWLWLRSAVWSTSLQQRLLELPAAQRFWWQPDQQLRPWQRRVPTCWLPAGTWQPLQHWFQWTVPTVAFAGTLPESVPLRLRPCTWDEGRQTQPNALLTNWSVWRAYVLSAPIIRLQPLWFACQTPVKTSNVATAALAATETSESPNPLVLVRGTPLPPLPATYLIESSGLILPLGWTWTPAVPQSVLRQRLLLEANEWVLFTLHGTLQRLTNDCFSRVSRSAIRRTEAAWLPVDQQTI